MVCTRRRVQGFQVSICLLDALASLDFKLSLTESVTASASMGLSELFCCFPSGHFKFVHLSAIQFVCLFVFYPAIFIQFPMKIQV